MTDGATENPKWIAARNAILEAAGCGRRVLVAYSGGKESAVVAHLAEAAGVPFSLIWSNTGFNFPHVEDFVRRAGARSGLVEVTADLTAQWQRLGLPTDLLSVSHALPGEAAQAPRLQTWAGCCWENRSKPLTEYLRALEEPAVVIHGQRSEDRAPGLGLSAWRAPGVTVCAPLADWTTADVLAYADAHGVALPAHYGEVADSLDCWCCPAPFAEAKGAARAAFMRRRYPTLAAIVLPGLRTICGVVDAARSHASASLALLAPPEDCVRQRSDDDCAIAAAATVTGRSYEETAAAFGFPCASEGVAPLPPGRGLHLLEVSTALLRLGMAGSIVSVNDVATTDADSPSSFGVSLVELRQMLTGRRAIVVGRERPGGRLHAFAWDGGQAIDCRTGAASGLPEPTVGAVVAAQINGD